MLSLVHSFLICKLSSLICLLSSLISFEEDLAKWSASKDVQVRTLKCKKHDMKNVNISTTPLTVCEFFTCFWKKVVKVLCFGFDISLDFEIQVSTDSTASLSGCCWDGTCCSSLLWISATTVTVSFCLFSAGPTLFCLFFSRTLSWGFTLLEVGGSSTISSSRSFSFSVLFEVLLGLKSGQLGCGGIWHGALAKQAPSLLLHINFAQPSSDAFLQDTFTFPISTSSLSPISNGLGSHGRQIFLHGSPCGITLPSLQARNHVTWKPLS